MAGGGALSGGDAREGGPEGAESAAGGGKDGRGGSIRARQRGEAAPVPSRHDAAPPWRPPRRGHPPTRPGSKRGLAHAEAGTAGIERGDGRLQTSEGGSLRASRGACGERRGRLQASAGGTCQGAWPHGLNEGLESLKGGRAQELKGGLEC